MDRHERRDNLEDVNVVITTYTVLTRDIEEMRATRHGIMVVLDEAQAVKSPDARATRAVCQLEHDKTAYASPARRSRTTWMSSGRNSRS